MSSNFIISITRVKYTIGANYSIFIKCSIQYAQQCTLNSPDSRPCGSYWDEVRDSVNKPIHYTIIVWLASSVSTQTHMLTPIVRSRVESYHYQIPNQTNYERTCTDAERQSMVVTHMFCYDSSSDPIIKILCSFVPWSQPLSSNRSREGKMLLKGAKTKFP